MSVGNFTADLTVMTDKHEGQKLLFIILSFALCILNLIATQQVITHILNSVNDSQAYSNYLTIIMVGMDIYNCFVYLMLAPFIGITYYKYVLMLVFLYFFLFVGFDLRLFHMLSRFFMDRASINDVGSADETPNQLRRRLLCYNLKHYVVLFLSFYVLIRFGLSGTIFYYLSMIPLFQIVHNVVCKVNYLPDQFDYLYASATKTFLFVD